MKSLLDERLDELAIGARISIGARVAAIIGVGLIALAFEPWSVCATWMAALLGVEAWTAAATRGHTPGRPATTAARLSYLGSLVTGVTGWFALGALLWNLGSPASVVCGVIIWLSVLGFAQVYAYQSRVGYLISGATPAAAMLVTVLVAPNQVASGIGPVWLTLLVAVAFAVSGARQTMTARRRYDEATDERRASELNYRLLADNITDVISLSAPDGQRLYVSPSIERILGFSPGELLRTPNYTYLHPDDLEMVLALIASIPPSGGSQTATYRVFSKDGEIVWAETTFTRLEDGSGRLVTLSRDVTHRKQLETELVEALARSEAAAAAKTDFLANMTHELRTPLNAILGFSGVLRDSKTLSASDSRHVGLIHDASATLLGVIGDVLDFSKLEAGAFELDPLPFDPIAAARSVAAMVSDLASSKGLDLRVEADLATPAVVGDAPRLRQVLLNFLSNAIKFTREGAVTLVVTHQVVDARCHLRMEVRDSGIGIPTEQIESVFMRFTQADASVSRRFGGTGLGLAISKQIVETMGGRIGADSVVGAGSTFWFEVALPVCADLTAASADDDGRASFDRRMRVLVVDDNSVNRELITALLQPFDIEIETAADGAEAVEAFGRAWFDVILMDVQMPVMDGLTAARRIRALVSAGVGRETPIVAMTANVLPEQIARCLDAGMNDHLGKPINPGRLLEALARWTQETDADIDTAPEAAVA